MRLLCICPEIPEMKKMRVSIESAPGSCCTPSRLATISPMPGRRLSVLTVSLAVLSSLTVAGGDPDPAAAATARAAGTKPTCGNQRPVKPGGGRYTCTFTDDFNGTTLDASKWIMQDSSKTGVISGTKGCYVTGPDNVSVSGGRVHLTARVEDQAFTCKLPFGGFTTTTSVATITTSKLFSQAYGRFEFRARFPNTSVAGLHSSLWMYPPDQTYGSWPRSGEIDVAERLTSTPSVVYPSIHYSGSTSTSTGRSCNVATAGSAFHRYAVQWTPTQMTFQYDGATCFTTTWTPDAPLVAPQPFDQPFDLVLTQAFGSGTNSRTAATPSSGTTDVDWVRAWS